MRSKRLTRRSAIADYYRITKRTISLGEAMLLRRTVLAATLCVVTLPAAAQQQVNVICPMAAEWCNMAATEFEKATGIKVGLTLKGSGEAYATVAAEKANPKHDIWYGGTGDPHLQAAEQELTIP